MKALKLVLIAALLTLGFTSTPAHSHNKAIKVVDITLAQAVTEPGLVDAMYDQLDMSLLKVDKNGNYSGIVNYGNTFYRVTGELKSWVRFFKSRPPVPIKQKEKFQIR
jgi:hypothetical protein